MQFGCVHSPAVTRRDLRGTASPVPPRGDARAASLRPRPGPADRRDDSAALTAGLAGPVSAAPAADHELPFPCRQEWYGSTRSSHSPSMLVGRLEPDRRRLRPGRRLRRRGGVTGWRTSAAAATGSSSSSTTARREHGLRPPRRGVRHPRPARRPGRAHRAARHLRQLHRSAPALRAAARRPRPAGLVPRPRLRDAGLGDLAQLRRHARRRGLGRRRRRPDRLLPPRRHAEVPARLGRRGRARSCSAVATRHAARRGLGRRRGLRPRRPGRRLGHVRAADRRRQHPRPSGYGIASDRARRGRLGR